MRQHAVPPLLLHPARRAGRVVRPASPASARSAAAGTHTHTPLLSLIVTVTFTVTLDFPDGNTSTPSAAKSQPSQRAPFNRPRTKSTALPGYQLNCHTLEFFVHCPLLPRQALDCVTRPTCWDFINFKGARFVTSLLPGLHVQGMFRRRSSNLWPWNPYSAASQLDQVSKGGANTGAFIARFGHPSLYSSTHHSQ
eukprot:364696-Chlamydomonas_euryale.AAC.14